MKASHNAVNRKQEGLNAEEETHLCSALHVVTC